MTGKYITRAHYLNQKNSLFQNLTIHQESLFKENIGKVYWKKIFLLQISVLQKKTLFGYKRIEVKVLTETLNYEEH